MDVKNVLSIGDRMKLYYENRYRICLTRRTPAIIRLDGKAFHTLTHKCHKPFDSNFMDLMVSSALYVAEKTQGFKLAYVQSDETSFLITDYDTLQTDAYFDYNIQKLVSIMSSQMSVCFSKNFGKYAVFDGRTFNIPESEIANYFLWRALDWQRNSVQMYAQSFFSHKELHQKDQPAMHEMLHGINKNWTTDLTDREKNGTWILKDKSIITSTKPTYEEIVAVLTCIEKVI